MKMFFALGALVALSAASAVAADGRISDHSLARMGLSSMKIMSDVDGMKIRGTSYAEISGGTGAHLLGAGGGSQFSASTTTSDTTLSGKSSSSATDTLRIGYFSASFTASATTSASVSITSTSKGGKP
jgi:hypothetical protein